MLNASAYLLCSKLCPHNLLCKVLAITAGCGYKGYYLVHKVGLKGPGSERPGGCSWHVMPVGIDTITIGHGSLFPDRS